MHAMIAVLTDLKKPPVAEVGTYFPVIYTATGTFFIYLAQVLFHEVHLTMRIDAENLSEQVLKGTEDIRIIYEVG